MKKSFKNDAKIDILTYVKMSRKSTLIHQCRQQCFQIKSLTPKKAGGCQFDNLTLSYLDFQKMIFLEKRQSPAICDFFRGYEDLLFQF